MRRSVPIFTLAALFVVVSPLALQAAQSAPAKPPASPSANAASETPSLAERVRKIVAEEFDLPAAKITPETNFEKDLGADDLDQVELTMKFEEAFNIEIPDDDAAKLKTVKDATDYIQKRLAALKPPQ